MDNLLKLCRTFFERLDLKRAQEPERLVTLAEAVHAQNQRLNLTAARTPRAILIEHVFDSLTLVPFLHKSKVFTAYEYLERRFDAKTRSLTSFLFLLSRGMSCGTIIAAPTP